MDHIAIMNSRIGNIDSIVLGKKVIESRWYRNKISPWNRIKENEVIYFKYSGKPVIAKALVKRVIQIENLNREKFKDIIHNYADLIQLNDREYSDYYKNKNYVILIFLKDAQYLDESFNICKKGFGSACAWMIVDDIERIKLKNK